MNTITKSLRNSFQRFLASGGYCTPPGRAACALSKARTLDQWNTLERAGLVRFVVFPDNESYFDVYGEPKGYVGTNGRRVTAEQERKEIVDDIDLNGCWYLRADYWNGEDWCLADGIGMCIYREALNPFVNDYVPDLMNSAISQIPEPGEH